MKKELKVIYHAIKPPIAGILEGVIGGFFAAPLVLKRYLKLEEKGDTSSIVEGRMAVSIGLVTAVISFATYTPFIIQSFNEGGIKRGLIASIPVMTNVISGGYELYKWAKNKAKEQDNSDESPKKKINRLESRLILSQTKNIETAIEYMSFNEDGSLKTNGNYGEEEKKVMYEGIVRKIPTKKITALRERLDNSLPYLKENEKNNPKAIKSYFKEKFGVPIANYQELDLFYQVILSVETEKQKRVLGVFRRR